MEEKHRQEKKNVELKIKAAAKLKEAKEQARKEKLRYHGIVESQVPSQRTGGSERIRILTGLLDTK